MNSDSLPTASSPRPADDTEVLSQRIPDQGEIVLETPPGEIPVAGHMGGKTPMDSDNRDRSKSAPPAEYAPETQVVPDSGRQPLSKGGEPPVPMTSVHPEAPNKLLEALCSASIDEEHHTIMSTVIEKVRSAKSGLTEACASLLIGFEVSNEIVREYHSIDSSP